LFLLLGIAVEDAVAADLIMKTLASQDGAVAEK
jgi:hypothetical protein